jgi:hypothetical protein
VPPRIPAARQSRLHDSRGAGGSKAGSISASSPPSSVVASGATSRGLRRWRHGSSTPAPTRFLEVRHRPAKFFFLPAGSSVGCGRRQQRFALERFVGIAGRALLLWRLGSKGSPCCGLSIFPIARRPRCVDVMPVIESVVTRPLQLSAGILHQGK